MSKLLKRCLSLLAAGTLVLGSVAFAADDTVANYDDQVMPISTPISQSMKLYVEGNLIDGTTITSATGTVMIPLRAVCEKMGYTVEWDAQAKKITLIHNAQYITINPSEDGYTFSKTAPMKLGTAPMNKDGYTYVPLSFIDEVLGGKTVSDIDFIYMTTQDFTDGISLNGEVKAVTPADAENNEPASVTVGLVGVDDLTKTVQLMLTDDTEISYKDGKVLPFSSIGRGDKVSVTFDKAMTKSIPAQANAQKIVVEKDLALQETNPTETEETAMYYGFVSEIKDGSLYMDGKDMQAKLIVHVAGDTAITDKAGVAVSLSDIKEGEFLAIEQGAAVTMSLPAQTTAISVRKAEYATVVGEVVSVDGTDVTISVAGDKNDPTNQLVLRTDDDTKFDKNGNFISVTDIKAGDKIEAKHSMATTMSLPPQSYAYTISVK